MARKLTGRKATILPLVGLGLVGTFGFVALATDLGIVAVARNQCQNAADAAAMAGTRALTGNSSSNNNATNAIVTAAAAAENNSVLTVPITASQVQLQIGSYTYNTTTSSFPKPPFSGLVSVTPGNSPGTNSSDNWDLVRATVTAQPSYGFSKIFGINAFNVSASATAAHRPRDIAIILDFSGSMRFASLVGIPFLGNRSGSNNPESVFPIFGGYSNQAAAALQNTATNSVWGYQLAPSNVSSTTSDGRPPIVKDFFQDTSGTLAFASALSDGDQNYSKTSPGDKYLRVGGQSSGAYAQTVSDITGSTSKDSTFESQGYAKYTSTAFNGYTQGPNYWGKTFFIWPPDPTNDWRQKYFGTTNNTKLWDNGGNWQDPGSGGYTINYTAILSWLKNTGPNPFPSQIRSGRIVYYTAIPDSIDTSTYPPTDLNQRFWKDYIDYVLGLMQTGSNSWSVVTGQSGYGDDFDWGNVQISSKPNGRYMDYKDNPSRPKLHFWFGPMSFVDFLGNYNLASITSPVCSRYNWLPGTCHDAPLYACKLGIQAALNDINNNHPNDYVSMLFFSSPKDSSNSPGNRFNRPRAPLGRDYQRMLDSLWYPLSTIENSGTTVNPYDYENNLAAPRAWSETCFAMPLMLAYNQFSTSSALVNYNPSPAPTGDAGGQGRVGAQKIIILETDGLPNETATANFSNNGAYSSYYKVRYNSTTPSSSEFPTINSYGNNDNTVTTQIYNICNQICAADSANPAGYSMPSKPVLIHCIGFGPVYDTGSPDRASALATLQQIQYIGKTQASASDALQSYKIITGAQDVVTANLQKAFTTILQGGVQVSLLE